MDRNAGSPKPRQRQEHSDVENRVLDINGNKLAGCEAGPYEAPADVVNESLQPAIAEVIEQTLQAPAEQVQPESIGRRVTAWFRRAGRH